jgi:glycosyl transferase family 25
MTGEFARIGLAFERIEAIDAAARPDLAEMPLRAKRRSKMRLADTEIACLLSHKACWETIAAGDDSHVAVFEDDLVFAAMAGALLADTGWIPADADIIKLETVFRKTVIGRKRLAAGHGFFLSRLHEMHMGTGGYIISRQAARDLVEGTREIGIPVDHVMFNPILPTSSSKTIYQLAPALCLQGQFLDEKAFGLPSLLKLDRHNAWTASCLAGSRRKAIGKKIASEFKRLGRQISNFCRMRQEMVIPFFHQGERIRPPHTQRRKNAL